MAGRVSRLSAAFRGSGRRVAACLGARPLLWSCLLAGAVTAVSAGLLAPSLYMSDDVSMAAFVDGSYTGEPVPHMVYTNVAVGLVLHSLYGAAGAVPWYGIYLFAAHFVALTVILYVVLADRRPGRGWRLLAVAAWLAVFGLWMGTQITFTQVSMLLGSAGVLLYLSRAALAQVHWAVVVAAGAVLGAAFLIRAQSLWAVLVLSLPLLLLALRRVPWRRQVLFAATAAAVLLLGWAVQTVYYADRPDWQEYSAFNTARGRLEWAVEQGVIDEGDLSAAGWSENDLAMFSSWFYADPDVYTAESFRQIAEAAGNPLRSPGEAAKRLGRELDLSVGVLGLSLTAALAGAAWVRGGRLSRRFIILTALWFMAVAAALLFFFKLPGRVAIPMLSFFALLLIALPEAAAPDAGIRSGGPGSTVGLAWRAFRSAGWSRREYDPASLITRVAVVVSAVVLVAGLADAVAGAGQRRAGDRSLDQDLARFTELDPEGTFISLGNALDIGRRSPWHAPVLPSPRLIGLGWQQRSPIFHKHLAEIGVDDLHLAFGSREDIYLPLPAESSAAFAHRYLTYLEEHYGFSGLLRPKAELGDFVVFDLAVAYQVDDLARVVIERRPDGSEVRYPFVEDAIVGIAHPHADPGVLRLVGWAADLDAGGPVDHIVAFNGTRAVAVAIPTIEPSAPAAIRHLRTLGLIDQDGLGFVFTVAGASDRGLRVFALSGGRTTEITG